MVRLCRWLLPSLLFAVSAVAGFEVSISDQDFEYQICSGMWGGKTPYINVTFDARSQGQLAMAIYEWGDVKYFGIETSPDPNTPKTYVCTSDARKAGFCDESQLGRFIVNVPKGTSIGQTSFWSARVGFGNETSASSGEVISTSGFWNNPLGNPTPPDADSEYTSPWRRTVGDTSLRSREDVNPSPTGVLQYKAPIQYKVRKTGYYCVAIIPFTVLSANSPRQTGTDVPYHPTYNGTVLFQNTFHGKLSAADYPKVNFYFSMFLVYVALTAGWGWLCYQNMQDLLPIQYYLSSLLGFLIVEMLANWAYYRYLNAHGDGVPATVFLIVVAVMDAGRNALSFFLLLIVSLGLSVVKESLGRTMLRCQILAGAHFIFGVLYAIGIVELELESTRGVVLLLFVIPLAITLSAFLLWILYSLNDTIAQLAARKQWYKLSMFTWLYRILCMSVIVIAIFFVVSAFTFSARLAEDYGAKSWKVQWWLLDGWLALLYLVDFVAVAWLWRPSPNNRRLAMFDEIAQDPADAEDYDMEALERREGARGIALGDGDDDTATLVGRGPGSVGDDAVVFEIGDEDDEDVPKKRRGAERQDGDSHEREGLIRDV